MKTHILRPLGLSILGLSLGASSLAPVQADANYNNFHRLLIGYFYQMESRDSYTFRSNGTYTFKAGPTKSKSGNVSHSGRWSLISYKITGEQTDECRVRLRSTSRVVMEGKKQRTLKANRTFNLKIYLANLEAPENMGVIFVGNQRFVMPGSEEND